MIERHPTRAMLLRALAEPYAVDVCLVYDGTRGARRRCQCVCGGVAVCVVAVAVLTRMVARALCLSWLPQTPSLSGTATKPSDSCIVDSCSAIHHGTRRVRMQLECHCVPRHSLRCGRDRDVASSVAVSRV
jgi:hypothetical protein